MFRLTLRHPALALAGLLTLAACQAGAGSPSSAASPSGEASVAATPSEGSTEPMESASADPMTHTVEVAASATLDDYLTDADGNTLYIFLTDSPGETSCFDSCLQNWPAFTVESGESPTAGDGISGALDTITRDDGSTQVTLEGWPLYYFSGDAAAGDTNGQGIGNVWYVARPDGSVPGAGAASQGYDY